MYINCFVAGFEYNQLSSLVGSIKRLHNKHIMGWYDGFLVDQRYKYFGYYPNDNNMVQELADSGLIYMDSEKCLRDAIELTLDNCFSLSLDTVFMFRAVGSKLRIVDLYGKSVKGKVREFEYRQLVLQAQELVLQGYINGFIYYEN